ncbi:hypothetical protein [Candidatus Chromulinivorax destructor]|uniref:Uncharacterized protein n=1 Tax=Candidatus Chromulinivorax destructor TaxID=2066483 RepID=A0A345ZAS1_9BACT|nr:hypothetical protein [Candidatus Chromulinivorax destructor]AXK60388.1 hypothetical protein C0J27_01310 [Candidatus Chromulinivorax destructor]
MIFYNYSDKELVIMNNTMSEFCNGLWNIDFQNFFSRDRDFLNHILHKLNMVVDHRMYCKYLSVNNMNVTIQVSYFNAHEIKMVMKILQAISQYMNDISHDGKADIATYEFKLTQKKIEELLSQMPCDNLSDDEVILMNYFLNEFFQELRLILSKTQNQEFLENILSDIQNILENKIIVSKWGAGDLMARLRLNQDEVAVLIKSLKLLSLYFEDWDVETRIGGSFLEIDALIGKIEYWQFGMKFNVISEDDLNVMYNFINELTYEISDVDYDSSFSCDKQFLENMLSKIMIIMDNRIFFKKWNDYNPLEASSLDVDEIKVVIKILEARDQYFNDEDFYTKFGYLTQKIEELKNKLKTLFV